MTATDPLRPEEVLGGLTGRRVSSALYAVQSRAGLLALADRHVAAPPVCEGMVATAERDYLAALRAGNHLPEPPRIQHLERSAPAWARLVPRSPSVRAGLAHALATRYRARASDVPRLRAAIGFAEPSVVAEHARRFGTEPDALWATDLSSRERLRWRTAQLADRLTDLPPFWSAFALTLTQTVGAGILALPIAMAGVGPLPGLVLLVALGLVNVLTVTAIAESVARTGTVRWTGAYLGGAVRQHLGRFASGVTALALVAFAVASLTAYYIGLADTLQRSLGLPPAVWVAVLFTITVAFVWRGRMGATITSALLVGALNLLIITLLTVAALTALRPGRLTSATWPLPWDSGFDSSVLGLIFGVVLMAYFGHTAVAAGAPDILRRDPSGRSLVRGTAVAMLVVIAVYAVWSVAVAGAVDGDRLHRETGTALTPLAEAVGPVVLGLGSVFVVTAMGMAAVHSSVGLHAQARELLRGRGGRALALLPLLMVFLLVELLVVTGRADFTAVLGLVGTVAIPVVGGVVPVLLLAATRRRGDYVPRAGLGWAAAVPVLAAVYLLFVAAVAAHGAVIWTGPAERMLAAATVTIVLGLTVVVFRSGAFRPLATLELRRDQELALDTVQLTVAGRPGRAEVKAATPSGLVQRTLDGVLDLPERTRVAQLRDIPAGTAALRVWAHEVDPWGVSRPADPRVSVQGRPVELREGTTSIRLVDGSPLTVNVEPGAPSGSQR
ncbi:aromatic amino acid transport family protein [Ornithinicoccus halotolerans]|uniref:aromatic amino acid transport family protein n=1 Tax=Ornithinicoccus halotolerans TaxID=1748220 RepID=UPI001295EE54|nr:aromatic amino acid transport family protein [Ornithinicoccus halotolerans]